MPLIILAAGPAFLARSLSLTTITMKQRLPFAVLTPWVFVLFLVTLQAELEKDPFDIPHAETEIVAGYGTEFSGRKLAFIRMSKDLQVVFGAALTVNLFLGGFQGPTPFGPEALWYSFWFILKTLLVVIILEYVRAICARMRIDQVVKMNWKTIIPLSVLVLTLTILCEPIFRSSIG